MAKFYMVLSIMLDQIGLGLERAASWLWKLAAKAEQKSEDIKNGS